MHDGASALRLGTRHRCLRCAAAARRRASAGVNSPWAECGLRSCGRFSMIARASAMEPKTTSFRHSSRNRGLKLSTKALCCGLPGAMSCHAMPVRFVELADHAGAEDGAVDDERQRLAGKSSTRASTRKRRPASSARRRRRARSPPTPAPAPLPTGAPAARARGRGRPRHRASAQAAVGLFAKTVRSTVTCPSGGPKRQNASDSVEKTGPATPPSRVQKFFDRSKTPLCLRNSMQP